MGEIKKRMGEPSGGDSSFPVWWAEDLASGQVFAEASMGFFGNVEYNKRDDDIVVKTVTKHPVLATLGCQLGGWSVGSETIMSGSLRLIAKKPSWIFDKLDFAVNNPAPVICVEGDASDSQVISELREAGIESAEIIRTQEDSLAQYINVPARAIETAIFRLMFLAEDKFNEFKITKATSNVTAKFGLGDPAADLNDAIRYDGQVTLMGDFGGFKDFETIVTKNTGFYDSKFGEVMRESGSVANCPLELFSVAELTIIDSGHTKAF